MSQTARDVLGAWNLTRWGRQRAEEVPIFFESARGRIFYEVSGVMSACLVRQAETDAALSRFFAYSGRWQIDGMTVHHAVDIANIDMWVGTTLTREVSLLDSQCLHLVTPALVGRDGAPLRDILEWTRIAVA